MKKYGKVDEDFADNLTKWADVIRKTFFDGGVDEVISTRRLDHIVKAFAIFGDKMKSSTFVSQGLTMRLKDSFKDLYKIDSGVDISTLTSDDSSIDAELAEMDEEEDDSSTSK